MDQLNVARDLRTPLASLQLTIEYLAGEAERHQQGLIRGAIDDIVYMGLIAQSSTHTNFWDEHFIPRHRALAREHPFSTC